MHGNVLLTTLTFGMVADDRQPGRASRRWIDDILKWRGKAVKGASGTDDKRQNSMAKVRG